MRNLRGEGRVNGCLLQRACRMERLSPFVSLPCILLLSIVRKVPIILRHFRHLEELVSFSSKLCFLVTSSSRQHATYISSPRPNRPSLRVQRSDSSRHTMEHHALLRPRWSLARDNGASRQRHRRSRHPAPLNRQPSPRWDMGIHDTQEGLLQ